MESFKLTLSNKATLTGLHSLAASSQTSPKHLPLIVGLHGGTFSAQYFDVDTSHTASIASNGLGVPFIAINRPGYKDSTSFTIPSGSTYPEEYGRWLHEFILPVLWTSFGQPRGCNSIILHTHSLGTTGAIVAGALYAQTPPTDRKYVLGGLSISGFGAPHQSHGPPNPPPPDTETHVVFPPALKEQLMYPPGTADPSIYQYGEALNNPLPVEEVRIEQEWFPSWSRWAAGVAVSVMVCLAGEDKMWKGTREHLAEFTGGFKNSERVDGSIIVGAPHNMEMSYWAKGYYARVFGFGMECAAYIGVKGGN